MNYARYRNVIIYALICLALGMMIRMATSQDYDSKFLYDTFNIIQQAQYNSNTLSTDYSYKFTAWFFKTFGLGLSFEFLPILLFLLTSILILVIICFLPPQKILTYLGLFPLLVGLFNIYNNHISKEYIQFWVYCSLIFTILYIKNNTIKLAFVSVTLIFFSILFRPYMIAVLIMYVVLWLFFKKGIKTQNILLCILCIIFGLIGVNIFFKASDYQFFNYFTARQSVNDYLISAGIKANTIIVDVINYKNSIFLWFLNLLINFIRLIFPIELIFKREFKYIIFVIVQLVITLNLIWILINHKKISQKRWELFIFYIAVLITHAIFEPDFGSYAKHQTAHLLILYMLLFRINYEVEPKENIEQKKVVHVVESFAGGTFDFIRDLVNGLNYYNHIIVHGEREDTPKNFKELILAKEFIKIKNFQREINLIKDIKALVEVIEVLERLYYDNIVIHLHSSKAGFIGRVACKLLGMSRCVIYTSHGVSFLQQDISLSKRRIFILLEKIASRLGGKVVACSKSEGDEFKKYGINAININNGLPDFLNNEKMDSTYVKKQMITLGSLGRIVEAKAPWLFNSIAEHFLDNENVRFLWIGDGPLKSILNSSNIKVTGWLTREEALKMLYNDIDIYLSTSLWEGLPLHVLQAMCFKKPLILHRCIGNVDLVIDNYNGFLYDKEEEAISYINILINTQELISQFGENSRKIFLGNFTIEKMSKEYENLYEKVFCPATTAL